MLQLLPLLVTALQMQAPMTDAELEQALADGVREKLAMGWTLVDVRGDDDELSLTLTNGKQVEAHVAHLDHDAGNAYRIDAGVPLPKTPSPPSAFTLLALSGGGGLEIGGDCGRLEARPYLLDAKAKGAAAARLVARTLKSSEDVEQAEVSEGAATFRIDLANGRHAELHVTLDDHDKVTAAELRRYEYGPDQSTHTRQRAMQRHIGARVSSIVAGDTGPVLIGSKRFEIDTQKFEANFPDDHTCGC